MISRQLAGILLVALGVAQLVISLTGSGGEVAVALGGAAFLAAFLATRAYGFLVPGAILTGVGVGLVLLDRGQPVAVLQLGLAAGFLAIPVLQLVTGAAREKGWWWPLLPAGILGALGAVALVDAELVNLGLPGLLVLAGIVAVASGARGAGKRAGRRAAQREAARAEREAAAALPAGAGDGPDGLDADPGAPSALGAAAGDPEDASDGPPPGAPGGDPDRHDDDRAGPGPDGPDGPR
jgi:hypothetical protein